MEGGQSLIAPDVLARYAADAAREVEGVAGLAASARHRGKAVSVSGDEDTLAVGMSLELEWGHNAAAVAADVQRRVSEYLEQMAQVTPASVDVVFDAVELAAAEAMTSRLAGLTGATLESAPSVCQTCIWWQSRGNREPDKRKWIERAETEWGAWGTIYRDDDGRVLGSMQYGPANLFPRAADLPGRPALRRRAPRDLRVPRSPTRSPGSSSRSSSPRSGRPATRAPARSRPSRTATARARRPRSGSSSTGPCSRATSWPTSASGPCAPPAGSSSRGSSWAGSSRSRRVRARRCCGVVQEVLQPTPAPAPPGL